MCCSITHPSTLKQIQTDIASVRRVLGDKTLEELRLAKNSKDDIEKGLFELSLEQEGKGRDPEQMMQVEQMTARKRKSALLFCLHLLP